MIERVNLRHRAIALLEQWFHEREACIVRPPHPLVVVQEMGLEESTNGNHVTGSTRRSGRSMPPIRDMPRVSRKVDQIMKHVASVNPRYAKALELWAEHVTLRNAAEATGQKVSQLFRDFDCGLAILQSEMIRERL